MINPNNIFCPTMTMVKAVINQLMHPCPVIQVLFLFTNPGYPLYQ